MPVVVKPVQRYIELTREHENKIDLFLKSVKKAYDPLPKNLQLCMAMSDPHADTVWSQERVYAYSFLHSREWDVDRALEMHAAVFKFRTENNLDDMQMMPSAFAVRGWNQEEVMLELNAQPREQRPGRIDRVCAGVDNHFSASLHYWDKTGLPVLYLMIGCVDEPGLLKKLKSMANIGQTATDVIFEYIQHAVGVGEMLALYQQKMWAKGQLQKDGVDSSAGLIRSVTIVVDVNGLNYKMLWKPALDLFQNALQKMFAYFPDCVNRIMVVNCPTMVMFAFNIVKGVLNDQVQRKVTFYNPKDTLSALEQVIDVKYIPEFLGGECHCEGNCVGSYDPHNPKRSANSPDGDDGDIVTEDIALKAGKSLTRTFSLKKDEEVFYEFALEGGKDITFSIYFVPASVSAGKTEFSSKVLKEHLVKKDSPARGSASYAATADGVLVLEWDNKQSWFSTKSLQMKVYKPNDVTAVVASPQSA